MSDLDKTIGEVSHILDCLILLRNILKTGDCNICRKKKECEFAPELGQMVRYNCPYFESIFEIGTKEEK